jgi:hypothetical protein
MPSRFSVGAPVLAVYDRWCPYLRYPLVAMGLKWTRTRSQHVGCSCVRHVNIWVLWRETTDHSRRNPTTAAIVGR